MSRATSRPAPVSTSTFVESELYGAVDALGPNRFDLVYTGIGALCWLPDIARWAEVVAALLRPGGRLYLREGHPVLWATEELGPGPARAEVPVLRTAGGRRASTSRSPTPTATCARGTGQLRVEPRPRRDRASRPRRGPDAHPSRPSTTSSTGPRTPGSRTSATATGACPATAPSSPSSTPSRPAAPPDAGGLSPKLAGWRRRCPGRYHSQVLRAAVIRPESPICKPRPVQALSAIFGRGPRGTTEPTLRSGPALAARAERSRDRNHAPRNHV